VGVAEGFRGRQLSADPLGSRAVYRTNHERELSEQRAALERDPENLELANAYWRALGNCRGHNVRNGSHPVEAFRRAALASAEGIIALCRASSELFEQSGEAPSARHFDEELVSVLQASLPALSPEAASEVRWVLSCLE